MNYKANIRQNFITAGTKGLLFLLKFVISKYSLQEQLLAAQNIMKIPQILNLMKLLTNFIGECNLTRHTPDFWP